MKQTAVEWLVSKLNLFNITKEEHYEILCQIELEAKEMEKQQQDEFSINFLHWYLNNDDIKKFSYSYENLLKTYKKEKTLWD